MKLCLYVLLLIVLMGCSESDSDEPIAAEDIDSRWSLGNTLTHDGLSRTYALYVPTTGMPSGLVVALHGSGDSSEGMISLISAEGPADANAFIVAVPEGVNNGWNDEDPPGNGLADDVGFIDALVTQLKASYPSILDGKTFAYGFSNGGGLATRLACESEHIRGIGVIGNYFIATDCVQAGNTPRIPGWFGAGLDDELVPVSTVRESMSGFVSELTQCTSVGDLQTVEVPDSPSGVICRQFSNCDLGRLCEYENRGHEALPGSLVATWNFLSARTSE